MKKASSIVIFFVTLFVLYVLIEKSTRMIEAAHPKAPFALYTVLGGILISGLMLGVYFLMKSVEKSSTDGFLYEAPLWTKCEGGPYMYSSSPELQEKCKNVDMSKYRCSKGYQGQPINFQRTPISNDHWENEMCSNLQSSIKNGTAYELSV